MSKAVSVDLRTRVLAAMETGASHRWTVGHWSVTASSVKRWRALARGKGVRRAGPLGGDRRSGGVEELRAALAERGHAFGYRTLQRFFRRSGNTRRKDRARQ